MATKVYKYELDMKPAQQIMMPKGAVMLDAQLQVGSGLCLWASVDTDAEPELRAFVLMATGEAFPQGLAMRHVSTFQGLDRAGHSLVFHLFEVLP